MAIISKTVRDRAILTSFSDILTVLILTVTRGMHSLIFDFDPVEQGSKVKFQKLAIISKIRLEIALILSEFSHFSHLKDGH